MRSGRRDAQPGSARAAGGAAEAAHLESLGRGSGTSTHSSTTSSTSVHRLPSRPHGQHMHAKAASREKMEHIVIAGHISGNKMCNEMHSH